MPSHPPSLGARARAVTLAAFAGIAGLALAGCVPNAPATGSALTVSVTDDSCAVSKNTAPAGAVTFTITNKGSDVNEFEILADDKLRVVSEKENITPGSTVAYTAQLEPGDYFTGCKFKQAGSPVGLTAFTVTGKSSSLGLTEQKLADDAVKNYITYVKSQANDLGPATQKLVDAYVAGYDATARALYAPARVFYERIEPTAEQFGDLDPEIDYREVDAVAEGLDWTGFHRIEKDLWPPAAGDLNSDGTSAVLDWAPSTPAERATLGQGLVDDVKSLNDLVDAPDFSLTVGDISNGAIGLLDEVAAGKITGEEDWWSHSDLSDFQANVQGAEVAFGSLHELVSSKGKTGTSLAADIEKQFDALNALLGQYGSIDDGFTPYDQVTDAQRKELSDQVNALAEPLSKLTSTVLGV